MTRTLALSALLAAVPAAVPPVAAQTAPADTTRDLGRVVVTATRTAEAVENVPVPTTVVTGDEIRADGALRLDDVLEAVPGVQLTEGFGTGVQIQGLDPAYTLVLIDGQPVVGRSAGVLDLARLSARGVERVEVVRGPSSSLYGSEALAGVVNLVTAVPSARAARLHARVGSFGTTALAAEAEGGTTLFGRAWGGRLVLDRTGTDGYDLDPALFGNTGPARTETTADVRLAGRLGDGTRVRLGARATAGDDRLSYAFTDVGGGTSPIDERGQRRDWSLHPEVTHAWGGRYALRVTGYASGFRLDTQVYEPDAAGADSLTYDDRFDQRLVKAEGQLDVLWTARHRTVVGAGAWQDALDGPRYGGDAPRAGSAFAFAQHDWEPSGRVAINASARFDAHDDVGARLSPKLAALVRPRDDLRVRLSVGSGFKAPDFRQLYLQFSNGVGGYTVFGAARLDDGLARLEAQGRYVPAGTGGGLAGLRPETSVAVNAEVEARVAGLDLTVGAFRNAVRDLIDVQPVAVLADGEPVYSYLNLARIRTEGLTAEVAATPRPGLRLDAGYQWLRSRDLDLLDALAGGTVFGRDAANRDVRLGPGDYGNLFGRSSHAVSARAALRTGPWTASLRARWRSRYGLRDLDGNGFANRDDEFVPATAIADATLARDVALRGLPGRSLRLQLGVDNLLGTTRPALVPSLAGRRLFASVELSF